MKMKIMKPSLFWASTTIATLAISSPTEAVYNRTDGTPCRANWQCLTETSYCNSVRECDAKKPNGAMCDMVETVIVPEDDSRGEGGDVMVQFQHESCLSNRCVFGLCDEPLGEGQECLVNQDCKEGLFCSSADGFVCTALKAEKAPCEDSAECLSGSCWRDNCAKQRPEGIICGADSDCQMGRCKTSEDGGGNRCQGRQDLMGFCQHNNDCFSLRCEDGACTEPVELGESCNEPSDCYSLFCDGTTFGSGCVSTPQEVAELVNEIENLSELDPSRGVEQDDPRYGITGSIAMYLVALNSQPEQTNATATDAPSMEGTFNGTSEGSYELTIGVDDGSGTAADQQQQPEEETAGVVERQGGGRA